MIRYQPQEVEEELCRGDVSHVTWIDSSWISPETLLGSLGHRGLRVHRLPIKLHKIMSTSNSLTDLTQRPPRSPRLRLGGYVLLPRILDKGRAALAGKLGEYHYGGKGMDRHFFNFVGLDHEALKAELAKGAGDWDLLAWVNAHAKKPRQPWEIAAWSEYHLRRTPDSDHETITEFAGEVKKFNPLREDINTWFDLLDLDDYCSFGGKA